MLQDPKSLEEVLNTLFGNYAFSMQYIEKMLENDHATGMMVDGLVKAASKDSVLTGKISDMITKYPDLILMTMHHYMCL